MYLSKLLPSPRSRFARRDIYNPYELHRTLANAFKTTEGVNYREQHGVLFRIEPLHYPGSQPVVIVQSNSRPEWNELPEEYLLNAETKSIAPKFRENQMLSFRLLANPTKKVVREGKRQGKKVPLLDKEEADGTNPAQDWLHRKGKQFGFEVGYTLSFSYWQENLVYVRNEKKGLPLYAVRFEGVLKVTDPDRMHEGLKKGIGPAKAFGFGLLSVARA